MEEEIRKLEKKIARAGKLKALVADREARSKVEAKLLAGLKKEERIKTQLAVTRARLKSLKAISTEGYRQETLKGKGKKTKARLEAALESAILEEIRREEKKLELEGLREELRLLQNELKPVKPEIERQRKSKTKKKTTKPVKKAVYKSKTRDIERVVIADLESILEEEDYIEGKKSKRYGNYYERNPKLRLQAVLHHGTSCMACGFDFGEIYGKHGTGFIEVHHLLPLSELEEETKIDPKTDMAVVCSNCHKMIHRRRDSTLSLKELKKILKKKD